MTRLFRSSLLATLVAAPLAAQQPPAAAPACAIDYNQPKELLTAYTFNRAKAIQTPVGDERTKIIKDILKTVSAPKVVAANAMGSAMIQGQMIMLYMMTPGTPAAVTKGALGLDGDKNAMVNLAQTFDSLFTVVEKAYPDCKSETKPFREAKPWQDAINGSFKALSAQKYDEAEALAKQSLVLDRTSPYAHRVFANVAQARNQMGEMLTHLAAALAATDGDTTYLDDRRAVQFQIGQVALEYGETQKEPTRTEILRKGANAMIALATESPAAEMAPFALSGLGMAAMSLKDTTLFTKCFTLVDGALDKFNDLSTLQAAVCANRAGKIPEAVRLFQATVAKNPNSRDGLYNAAALMYDQKQGKEMLPIVTKLTSIDPSNPDNISLFAYAYNRLNEAFADSVAKAQKAAPKPAKPAPGAKPAPLPPAPKNIWVDSVAKYMKISDDMPHRVTMTEFNRFADKAQLRGEIENKGKAARGYELEIEFLDLEGNVVDKQTAKVASVEPNKAGTFSFDIAKPKVAAWRYAPIK